MFDKEYTLSRSSFSLSRSSVSISFVTAVRDFFTFLIEK